MVDSYCTDMYYTDLVDRLLYYTNTNLVDRYCSNCTDRYYTDLVDRYASRLSSVVS